MSNVTSDNIVGTPENPLTLSKVASGISGRIAAIPKLWLIAEVLRINKNAGGIFVTLVDSASGKAKPATLTAVVDVELVNQLPISLTPGNQVIAFVTLSYWSGSGHVGARIFDLRLAGDGALLAAIETLRQKLAKEGLFDPSRKQLLPALPSAIGLITGAGSDAESDVITRTKERWSAVSFVVKHAPMQGLDCVSKVIAALEQLDSDPTVEVIVIARGGGSVTDLAPFSNETLVRAVAKARTPIVSAIGHEPDTPILDNVADRRSGTPTQAAIYIVADVSGELVYLSQALTRMANSTVKALNNERQSLQAVASRPVMSAPTLVADRHLAELERNQEMLRRHVKATLMLQNVTLDSFAKALVNLSPQATLDRGYAVVRRADGSSLGPVNALGEGVQVDIRTKDGHVTAVTTSKGAKK